MPYPPDDYFRDSWPTLDDYFSQMFKDSESRRLRSSKSISRSDEEFLRSIGVKW